MNEIIWICRCGEFETNDSQKAFIHRDKYGSNDHLVKPVYESEIVRPSPTLTGIELHELEEMEMPISPFKGGIRD
jgi:hypothetical protein